MRRNRRNNKITAMLLLLAVCAFYLTGCGDAIPEMSEKQADMMTEYAASSLLEHTSGSSSRLVDTSVEFNPDKMTKYEKEKLGIAEPDPEPAPPEVSDQPETDASSDSGEGGGTAAPAPEPAMTATEVIGCDGVEITMTGFSVLDSYPEAGSGTDTFFSMDATDGNQLVIARLSVKNTGSEAVELKLAPRTDLHFNMILNGETSQNALLTMLSDDFSTMSETLEPGQDFPAVLISQVSSDVAGSLTNLSVEIRSDLGKAVLSSSSKISGSPAPAPESSTEEGTQDGGSEETSAEDAGAESSAEE